MSLKGEIITLVFEEGPISNRQISEQLGLDWDTIRVTTHNLSKKGYLKREWNEGKKRKSVSREWKYTVSDFTNNIMQEHESFEEYELSSVKKKLNNMGIETEEE